MDFLEELDVDLKTFIMILVIVIGAIILTRFLRWLITKSFDAASLKLEVDPTRYKFLKNAASLVVWVLAIAAITLLIPRLRGLAISLFAGAGILVAILGLAAQQAFSNIISGIFIVMFRPFRVGDLIKVGTMDYGVVEDITLRHTVIKSFQNKRIIIPNSVVSDEYITNDSIGDSRICRFVEFGISYDSDPELATSIMQEEAEKHPKVIDGRTEEEIEAGEPKILVRVISYGDFSVLLRAYVWVMDPMDGFQMHSDLNKSIKTRFDAEGIEIPFPYRTIVYKNDLPPNAGSDTKAS